ncbi:uncharacterized protein BDZ99DRAFT_470804 [Mytilinidion resinicola]|uniref:Uncharacterized protein n=1 Tax=Mytilinidion resinicola TaxID=574789 RepID=A0A6A6ZA00_9PEZI|nr:uncharacterized protein BDZ99DRAFT_470804 [Mytilinidion resinicola]KAF2817860.1 hypothetical protein BDZ99DRAFT_470804 [Mytilinidion resinicola]
MAGKEHEASEAKRAPILNAMRTRRPLQDISERFGIPPTTVRTTASTRTRRENRMARRAVQIYEDSPTRGREPTQPEGLSTAPTPPPLLAATSNDGPAMTSSHSDAASAESSSSATQLTGLTRRLRWHPLTTPMTPKFMQGPPLKESLRCGNARGYGGEIVVRKDCGNTEDTEKPRVIRVTSFDESLCALRTQEAQEQTLHLLAARQAQPADTDDIQRFLGNMLASSEHFSNDGENFYGDHLQNAEGGYQPSDYLRDFDWTVPTSNERMFSVEAMDIHERMLLQRFKQHPTTVGGYTDLILRRTRFDDVKSVTLTTSSEPEPTAAQRMNNETVSQQTVSLGEPFSNALKETCSLQRVVENALTTTKIAYTGGIVGPSDRRLMDCLAVLIALAPDFRVHRVPLPLAAKQTPPLRVTSPHLQARR